MFHMKQSLILASTSPRRQQFLRDMGLKFMAIKPERDEPQPLPGEAPADYVDRVAAHKAADVAFRNPGHVVVAADTVVVIGQEILGKPMDEMDSLRMLALLAGKTHTVITAVQVIFPDASRAGFACSSQVRLYPWPRAVLAAYARSGESLDKAGAYAVQGKGAFLVASITGSWSNVVGLPVAELIELLLQHGLIEVC